MPYASDDDVPAAVKTRGPKAASIFRNVFNSAHSRGLDEKACFRMAWGSIKKKRVKNQSGG